MEDEQKLTESPMSPRQVMTSHSSAWPEYIKRREALDARLLLETR
jgi:hypothetical protein